MGDTTHRIFTDLEKEIILTRCTVIFRVAAVGSKLQINLLLPTGQPLRTSAVLKLVSRIGEQGWLRSPALKGLAGSTPADTIKIKLHRELPTDASIVMCKNAGIKGAQWQLMRQ